MSLRWSVGASHEQGKRSNQEDSIFGEFDGENSVYPLIVLADGMGGHSDGEKASGLVTKAFFEVFRSRKGRTDASSFPGMLREAAREASDILRKAKEGQFPAWWKEKKGPIGSDAGCTLLAAYIDEKTQEVYFLSVGDSLILLQTNGVWQWVNKLCLDTRLNQLLGKSREDRHVVSDVEYEFQRIRSLKDPKAHGLTQAITGRREPNLVGHILGPFPLRAGDRFILASDGLEPFFVGDESLRDDRENFKDLERFLADIPVPRPTSGVVTMCRQSTTTAKNIVQQVLNLHRPNQDNISVVLVEIPSDKAPAVAVSPPRRRHDTEPSPPSAEITVPRDSEAGGISVDAPDSKEVGSSSFWKKASCFLLLLVIALGGVIWNYLDLRKDDDSNVRRDDSNVRRDDSNVRRKAMLGVLKTIKLSYPINIVIDKKLKGELQNLGNNASLERVQSLLRRVYEDAFSLHELYGKLYDEGLRFGGDQKKVLPCLNKRNVETLNEESIEDLKNELDEFFRSCESLKQKVDSRVSQAMELLDELSKKTPGSQAVEFAEKVLENFPIDDELGNNVSIYGEREGAFSSNLGKFRTKYCEKKQIKSDLGYKERLNLCADLDKLITESDDLMGLASHIGCIFLTRSEWKAETNSFQGLADNVSLSLSYKLYAEHLGDFKDIDDDKGKDAVKEQLEHLLKQIDAWRKETERKISYLRCSIFFRSASPPEKIPTVSVQIHGIGGEKIKALFCTSQEYVVAAGWYYSVGDDRMRSEDGELRKRREAYVDALADWYCSPPDAFSQGGKEGSGSSEVEEEGKGKKVHVLLTNPLNGDRDHSKADEAGKHAKTIIKEILKKII